MLWRQERPLSELKRLLRGRQLLELYLRLQQESAVALLGPTRVVLEPRVQAQVQELLLPVVLEQALRRSPCEESLQEPPLAGLHRGFALTRLQRHPHRAALRLAPWQSKAEVPVLLIRLQQPVQDRLNPPLCSQLRLWAWPQPTSWPVPSWPALSWRQLS